MSEWIRVSKARPCPICKRPDWCGHSADGAAACCMRTESDKPAKNGGWIHRLTDEAPRERKPIPKPAPGPSIDAAHLMRDLWLTTPRAKVDALAASLGVSPASLHEIGCAWSSSCNAFAFPMRDGGGKIVGVRLRNETGEKWAVKGSKVGLFHADELSAAPAGIAYICEGPTDTAAALTLGLWAVGRAACLGQADQLKSMLKGYGVRKVVIISDHDEAKERPDGSAWYPGQDGARKLAKELGMPHKILIPPAKDLRAWLRDGATSAAFACIERNHVWKTI